MFVLNVLKLSNKIPTKLALYTVMMKRSFYQHIKKTSHICENVLCDDILI